MSASTVLPGGPQVPPAAAGGSLDALVERMAPVCAAAVDVDEVAVFLEAGGITDRIAARDYGAPSVFALAAHLLQRAPAPQTSAGDEAGATSGTPAAALPGTLVRAGLYLTPAVIAVGAAGDLGGLPRLAAVGALIFGWAVAQALAFVGYCALGPTGPAGAARLLGVGFGLAIGSWAAVMGLAGVGDLRAHAIAAGQLVLFAATAAALVTGGERPVLVAAAVTWLAAAVAAAGGGLAPLAVTLLAMAVVAFRPALRPPLRPVFRHRLGAAVRWRPAAGQCGAAVAHGTVGAGQAVLFAAVILAAGDPSRLSLAALPLLAGVPLTELILIWHQRRVAVVRARLSDRQAYGQRLRRVSAGTLVALAVPVAGGAGLGAAGLGRLAAATLLTAVYGLCLVLVAHRRLGLAALLVWWPAVLIGLLYRWLPAQPDRLVELLFAVVLFAICVPALGVAAMVLGDRWSYR